jgi:hypothetical protein
LQDTLRELGQGVVALYTLIGVNEPGGAAAIVLQGHDLNS